MTDFAKTPRMAAAEDGEMTYRSTPCKRGHDPLRWVSTGSCVQCTKDRSAKARQAIKDAIARGRAPTAETA